MAAFKFNCPKCGVRMLSPEKFPAKLLCPKCQARFLLFADGKTEVRATVAKDPASSGASSSSIPANIFRDMASETPPAPAPVERPSEAGKMTLSSSHTLSTTEIAPGKPKTPLPTETGSESIRATPPPLPPPRPSTAAPPGFIQKLQTLPKPVLFGLYGAIGGLLGVLLLGELCWALIKPAAREKPILQLGVSATVSAYHGGNNVFPIRIARLEYDGPVAVEVLDLPKDVHIPSTVISPNRTEADLEVVVGQPEDVGVQPRFVPLRLRISPQKERNRFIEQSFQLDIQPLPRRVVAAYPPIVEIYPGEKNVVPIKIARLGFGGPVKLEAAGELPAKISVLPATIPAGQKEGGVTVAIGDLPLGEFPLKLRAVPEEAGADSGNISLTVKTVALPPFVQLAIPPTVVIYSGGSNRFGIKIARQRFEGPVQLAIAEPPPEIKFAPVTIPAQASAAEIELGVGDLPANQAKEIRLNFQATGPDGVAAASEFMVLKAQPQPPTLQMATSAKVAVYAGDKVRIPVKIARQRFTGAVHVEAAKLGLQVTVAPINIAPGKSEAELEVSVGNVVGKHPLQIEARAQDVQAAAGNQLELNILPLPTSLRMTVSPKVELFQVGKCRFSVRVARGGFSGPVSLEFANVPAGVSLPTTVIPLGIDEKVVEGTANAKADLGAHKISVTAKGGPGVDGKNASVSGDFALDVKVADKKAPPLDIMFVLDVTGSMQPQINGVRDGIGQFIAELENSGLEARVGMVAFRDIIFDGKNAIQLQHFNGNVFTKDFKLFSNVVGKLKEGGGGDPPESSLDAMVAASNVTGYRPNAVRILLLITDDMPQTLPPSVTMLRAMDILKKNKIDQVHLIVPRRCLPIYEPLQQSAKGVFFDLHEATKGKGGFAGLLPELSKAIAQVTVAAGPEMPLAQAPPPLPAAKDAPVLPKPAAPPPPPAEQAKAPPKVEAPPPLVKAVAAPPKVSVPAGAMGLPTIRAESPPLQAVASTTIFSEDDKYQLLLAMALWTAAMSAGIGLCLVAGQKLYLRKGWLGWSAAGMVVASSLAAGFVGGVGGQFFYQSTTGEAAWGVISRGVAWTVLGGLLSSGLAFFVPNLSRSRALLGGCVGGLMGALAFALFTYLLHDAPGRVLGGAIMGFFIGMMIALSELAFRRYWLEITYGAREVRTVTLGAVPVAVGSAEASAIFVQGAPPLAGRYWMEEHRVLFEDAATGAVAEVQAGERRQVAGVSIAVCSPSSARAAGLTLKLSHGSSVKLTEGLPLTRDDIPGLDPQGEDGLVALVSRRPSDPTVLLLRNRSKQTWKLTDKSGVAQEIRPGLGLELAAESKIDFGAVRGTLQ